MAKSCKLEIAISISNLYKFLVFVKLFLFFFASPKKLLKIDFYCLLAVKSLLVDEENHSVSHSAGSIGGSDR